MSVSMMGKARRCLIWRRVHAKINSAHVDTRLHCLKYNASMLARYLMRTCRDPRPVGGSRLLFGNFNHGDSITDARTTVLGTNRWSNI